MLALLAGREASTMVFGLKPWDPATLIAAAALLAVVTVVTSIVPALKAAQCESDRDPAVGIRLMPNTGWMVSCSGGRGAGWSSMSRRVMTEQRA